MRKVTYGFACSLDGYIAGPKGEIDWLIFSKDAQDVMAAYFGSIDTIVMGRKTWEPVAAHGSAKAPLYPGIRTYVFSRTVTPGARDGVEVVNENVVDFVSRQKLRSGKDICVMGGGELAAALFDADLIDEVGCNIHPILLGSGIPGFLRRDRRLQLELIESRRLEGGCVLVNYRVPRAGEMKQ